MPARGFTLVELMVVISIIAILAVVGITIFSGVQKSARYNRTVQDMENIDKSVKIYESLTGNYPGDVGPGIDPGLVPTYLSSFSTPQCTGYTYDYENWSGSGGNLIRISLRKPSPGYESIFYYCIDSTNSCDVGEGAVNILTTSNKTLTCS